MMQVNARIDKEIYDRLSQYSELTGVPVSRCIAEACERWLMDVAPGRVESMARRDLSEMIDGKAKLLKLIQEPKKQLTKLTGK
jgi:hypothetical protein